MRNLKILLVDDNPNDTLLVKTVFEMVDQAVTCVVNGQEAVDVSATQAFDLILMDVQMPVMGGYEAIRQIRSAEAATGRRASRICTLAADRDPVDIRASRDAGADHHVAKPIYPAALYAAMTMARIGRDRAA
jgi:CheY-like chemotaxis protein